MKFKDAYAYHYSIGNLYLLDYMCCQTCLFVVIKSFLFVYYVRWWCCADVPMCLKPVRLRAKIKKECSTKRVIMVEKEIYLSDMWQAGTVPAQAKMAERCVYYFWFSR